MKSDSLQCLFYIGFCDIVFGFDFKQCVMVGILNKVVVYIQEFIWLKFQGNIQVRVGVKVYKYLCVFFYGKNGVVIQIKVVGGIFFDVVNGVQYGYDIFFFFLSVVVCFCCLL